MPPQTYPPPIQAAHYRDVAAPPLVVEQHCGPDERCSLTGLGLGATATSAVGTSFNQPHAELDNAAAGRYRIAPGAETLYVVWTLVNPQLVDTVRLRLFGRKPFSDGGCFWDQKITWEEGRCPSPGGARFTGEFKSGGGMPGGVKKLVTVVDVGRDALTAALAPFKLVMSITPLAGKAVDVAVRWIYVDVVVADLEILLGPSASIPVEAAKEAAGFNRRNRALWTKLDTALNPKGGRLGPTGELADAQPIRIPLDGNIFAIEGDLTDNTGYTAWKAAWRDGPYIPLKVVARLLNSLNAAVVAPLALTDARFLWDWEGGDALLGLSHPLARDLLTQYYDRKSDEWPTGASNAHTAVGGKRGEGAQLFKAAAPFPLSACDQRKGAVFTGGHATGAALRTTEVAFWPSTISGDKYKLTVYFAYGARDGWDVESTAGELRDALPVAVPSRTTRTLLVERIVTVARHWTLDANFTVNNAHYSWQKLLAYFKQAGLGLDLTPVYNGANVLTVPNADDYRDALVVACRKIRTGLAQFAVAPRSEQALGTYGIKFRPYDAVKRDIGDAIVRRYGELRAESEVIEPYRSALCHIHARISLYLLFSLKQDELDSDPGLEKDLMDPLWEKSYDSLDQLKEVARVHLYKKLQEKRMPESRIRIFPETATAVGLSAEGDRAVGWVLLKYNGMEDEGAYLTACKELGQTVLCQIARGLSVADRDQPGIHLFQWDYHDNFMNLKDSGLAFRTLSNQENCLECGESLSSREKGENQCDECQSKLRSNTAVFTVVPWRFMKAYDQGIYDGLASWMLQMKYWILSNIEGTTPEILVAHEMGHQLFLPHAPFSFTMPKGNFSIPYRWKLALKALQRVIGSMATPGGSDAALHVAGTVHTACIMGYDFGQMPELHFCAKCVLRLRGWNVDVVRQLPS
jgi:hypothetical protein